MPEVAAARSSVRGCQEWACGTQRASDGPSSWYPARLVPVTLTNRPPTSLKKAKPVLPTCDFCAQPIRPGEKHGEVEAGADGPEVKCYVVRVAQVETV